MGNRKDTDGNVCQESQIYMYMVLCASLSGMGGLVGGRNGLDTVNSRSNVDDIIICRILALFGCPRASRKSKKRLCTHILHRVYVVRKQRAHWR